MINTPPPRVSPCHHRHHRVVRACAENKYFCHRHKERRISTINNQQSPPGAKQWQTNAAAAAGDVFLIDISKTKRFKQFISTAHRCVVVQRTTGFY